MVVLPCVHAWIIIILIPVKTEIWWWLIYFLELHKLCFGLKSKKITFIKWWKSQSTNFEGNILLIKSRSFCFQILIVLVSLIFSVLFLLLDSIFQISSVHHEDDGWRWCWHSLPSSSPGETQEEQPQYTSLNKTAFKIFYNVQLKKILKNSTEPSQMGLASGHHSQFPPQ